MKLSTAVFCCCELLTPQFPEIQVNARGLHKKLNKPRLALIGPFGTQELIEL